MLKLDKIHEDQRGQIYLLTGDLKEHEEITIFTTKKGFARGGCVHRMNEEIDVVLEGKIRYFVGEKAKKAVSMKKGDAIKIPKNTPHYFLALADSLVVEWGATVAEKKEKHSSVRRIVEESNSKEAHKNFKFRKKCLICNSEKLVRIIDLGIHPYADTFIPASKLSKSEPVYPLCCDLCKDCGHIQNACITDPGQRYSLYDYSYTSSSSAFARDHWKNYAKEVSQKLKLEEGSFIIEPGSNDGFLAEQFQKRGFSVLGVDPSKCMADLAKKRNVKTIVNLFSFAQEKIKKNYGRVDLIVANNVFNHSDNPVDFIKTAVDLLKPNGAFVFESPYWYVSFKGNKFDQIYHEHPNYFTVKSAKKLLGMAGFVISDVKVVPYHGGSLRIFAKKKQYGAKESLDVKKMISKEVSSGVFNPKSYQIFMREILLQRNKFLEKIYRIKAEGKSIIGVGAPAKGNTFLNFYNLDNSILDYVTDSSPYKYGKYTPFTRIPIKKDEIFAKYKEVYAIVLSWNLSEEIKKNLWKINKKIRFISPRENKS